MPEQRVHIMIGAIIDVDKWFVNQEQNEEKVQQYLEMAAQDKINKIQGGNPLVYHSYSEIEYSDSI